MKYAANFIILHSTIPTRQGFLSYLVHLEIIIEFIS
jgi:hypothetical protein